MEWVEPDRWVLDVRDVAGVSGCEWEFACAAVRARSGLPARERPAFASYVARLSAELSDEIAAGYSSRADKAWPVGQGRICNAGDRGVAAGELETASLWRDVGFAVGDLRGRAPLVVATKGGWRLEFPRFSSHLKRSARLRAGGVWWLACRTWGAERVCTEVVVHLATGRRVSIAGAQLAREWELAVDRARSILFRLDEVTWDTCASACGTCAECRAAIEAHDDLFALPGVGRNERAELRARGITTVAEVALQAPPGVSDRTVAVAAARVEQRSLPAGPYGPVVVDRVDSQRIARVEKPAPGDVYLDFENDSLWGWDARDHTGLIYLTGLLVRPDEADGCARLAGVEIPRAQAPVHLDGPEAAWTRPGVTASTPGEASAALGWRYVALWAHSRRDEAAVARAFVDWLERRRRIFPDMHVYHYSPQEPLMLTRLARRGGLPPRRVEALTGRRGIFVDLFEAVREGVVTGQAGMSLKDLEPLFMGPLRRGDLDDGGESVVAYDRDVARASRPRAETLARLAAYNEYDCAATLQLHRWLLAQAGPCAEVPSPPPYEVPLSWGNRDAVSRGGTS